MTQCDMILQYLNEFGSITPLEALRELGIYRLASRICDLSNRGIDFKRTTISTKNKYGKPTHFTKYELEGE